MPTSRVYILRIYLATSVYETERSLAYTLLRRRADGPLLVRDHGHERAGRSQDGSKLRYTTGYPFVQAVFSDSTSLARAEAELRAHVPRFPTGVVRCERRRNHRPEPACACVLAEIREFKAEGAARTLTPHYKQVAACHRHAQLLPRCCAMGARGLVQQQGQALVGGKAPAVHARMAVTIDELPSIVTPPGTAGKVEALLAAVTSRGRKIALYP
jgi:hypothetical protein